MPEELIQIEAADSELRAIEALDALLSGRAAEVDTLTGRRVRDGGRA